MARISPVLTFITMPKAPFWMSYFEMAACIFFSR